MEDDWYAVSAKPQVAFDTCAGSDCRFERRQTVLGNAGTVEPAMREPHWPGIERIRRGS